MLTTGVRPTCWRPWVVQVLSGWACRRVLGGGGLSYRVRRHPLRDRHRAGDAPGEALLCCVVPSLRSRLHVGRDTVRRAISLALATVGSRQPANRAACRMTCRILKQARAVVVSTCHWHCPLPRAGRSEESRAQKGAIMFRLCPAVLRAVRSLVAHAVRYPASRRHGGAGDRRARVRVGWLCPPNALFTV